MSVVKKPKEQKSGGWGEGGGKGAYRDQRKNLRFPPQFPSYL